MTPDAPEAPTQTGTISERLVRLETDVFWVKKVTANNVVELNEKLDTLINSWGDFQSSIKSEIKKDLSEEFAGRFVPKKALCIAIGLSGGIGLVSGATFQPIIKLLLLGG